MTEELETVTVSKAFQEHLRGLCLYEFPCGLGSWNRSRFFPQILKAYKNVMLNMIETVSPEEETVDDLLRLVRSSKSPWTPRKDSTMEDQYLRELAIQNPLIIGNTFLFSYFKSLRLVDKGVTLVDKDLLKFLKLEELILSANRIREVNPMNLPRTLKVLELYGNEITTMECLCSHPPPALQHLGLGHNRLLGPMESNYITASYWPNLVSLDLGYNDLTELRHMIAGLCTLQLLRLLVLHGNPLALVPYYRGYTIDSLPQLCVLDDITVSHEEKHLFQGLSHKLKVSKEEEAQLIVTVKNVTGIMDSSVLDPEPAPEGPYIAYTYYVAYNFFEDEKDIEKENDSIVEEVIKPIESPVLSAMLTREGQSETEAPPTPDPRLIPAPGSALFSTLRKPWTNIIEFDYKMKHNLKNLVPLKAFLTVGTNVAIVEEKIVSWQILPSPVDSPPSVKKGKGEKDKKEKEKEKDKGKGKGKEKEKEKEKAKEKAKKKKKEPPKEFRQDPPILRVLGSHLVSLEPLLSGETLVASVCNFGTLRTAETDKLTYIRDQKTKKGGKKKDKDKKKENTMFEEPDYQPDPLTVDIQIQLRHYKSLIEAMTPSF